MSQNMPGKSLLVIAQTEAIVQRNGMKAYAIDVDVRMYDYISCLEYPRQRTHMFVKPYTRIVRSTATNRVPTFSDDTQKNIKGKYERRKKKGT